MYINRSTFDIRSFCMSDEMFTGKDIIRAMYNYTDEADILAVKDYRADDPGMVPIGESEYLIDWGYDESGVFKRLEEFETFLKTLRQASQLRGADDETTAETGRTEDHIAALRFFSDIFLKPIHVLFSDTQKKEILYNLNVIDEGAYLCERVRQGIMITDDQRTVIEEYKNHLADRRLQGKTKEYFRQCYKEAERRVGSGPMAYDLITHCLRYCHLLSSEVPDFVLKSEEQRLALAYIIHYYSRPHRICDARAWEQ